MCAATDGVWVMFYKNIFSILERRKKKVECPSLEYATMMHL